jgi:cytochrome b6-f complex iron-sulfur subunit
MEVEYHTSMENKSKQPHIPTVKRRRFMEIMGWGVVGSAAAGIAWITGRFLSASSTGPELGPVGFGVPRDYPVGSSAVNGRVVLLRDGKGFWAITAICPHLGCQPTFDLDKNLFVCPCHGSIFDAEGRFLSGPAKKDMRQAAVGLDAGGRLIAHPEKPVPAGWRLKL